MYFSQGRWFIQNGHQRKKLRLFQQSTLSKDVKLIYPWFCFSSWCMVYTPYLQLNKTHHACLTRTLKLLAWVHMRECLTYKTEWFYFIAFVLFYTELLIQSSIRNNSEWNLKIEFPWQQNSNRRMKIFVSGDSHATEKLRGHKQNNVYCPGLAFNYSFDNKPSLLIWRMMVLWGPWKSTSLFLKTHLCSVS